jgi:hypothetical protein
MDASFDDLANGERELEIMERRFYSQLASNGLAKEAHGRDSPRPPRPPSRASFLGISRDRPELFHPLYMEMREAFRNLQLAREDQHNLSFKRAAIEHEDLRFSKETSEFLSTVPRREKQAEAEVERWVNEFDRLQTECQKLGVIPISTPFYKDSRGYQPVIKKEEDAVVLASFPNKPAANRPKTLSHPRYPVLMSNPKHVLHTPLPETSKEALRKAVSIPKNNPSRGKIISEAIKEHGIDTLLFQGDLEDKNDYVNRWLLHKLRTSAMEVGVLCSVFQTALKFMHGTRWQLDVLSFWSRDDAVVPQKPPRDSAIMLSVSNTTSISDKRDPLDIVSRPQTRSVTEASVDLSHIGSWPLENRMGDHRDLTIPKSRSLDLDGGLSYNKNPWHISSKSTSTHRTVS